VVATSSAVLGFRLSSVFGVVVGSMLVGV
jgi:hypothetical protein